MSYRNSRTTNRYLKWNKKGGQWTIAKQRGWTGSQLIIRETGFYFDNRLHSISRRRMAYCDGLAEKFDKVPYVVRCICGDPVTCYEIQPNNPQPVFMCESCGNQGTEESGSGGSVCTAYGDIFAVIPGNTMKDRALRNEVLRYVREAKGFRKYVTAGKSSKFLCKR